MNSGALTKKSFATKILKHALYFLAMVVALLLILKIGVSVMGTNAEQIIAMREWRHSSVVMFIRFGVYAVLWFFWPALMRKVKSDFTDDHIKSTRKPLIILLVVYEAIIARDITTFISSWFAS